MGKHSSGLPVSPVKNILKSFSLRPFGDVLFVTEGRNWVTSQEIRGVSLALKQIGIRFRYSEPIRFGLPGQSIFLPSVYFIVKPSRFLWCNNRIAFPFYHGYPSSGNPLVLECHKNIKKYHHKISRIQASHSFMRDLILESGINPQKVFLIPIAVDDRFFSMQTADSKRKARERYQIPQTAVVIGSFQKDGVGWGDGLEPKLVKGPDVFLDTIGILKESISELFVLISGPSRGYIIKGLDKLSVPYKHVYLDDYSDIGRLYQCLDLYIIASREEGGPKAVLESMISGVPLVTTRVGQAMDMVDHCENALMVDVEDTEGLAYWSRKILSDTQLQNKLVENAFVTANNNTYLAHAPLWKMFFKGFVSSTMLDL